LDFKNMLDPVRNFAKVTVSQGYDSNATQITLVTGDGAKLPDPATEGAFNLVWYNDTDYKDPADDPYVEIVRVTAKSGDTLTIQRGQEGTSAQNHNLSGKTYKMVLSLTKKTIDDLQYLAINTQTANYTLVLTDAGKLINMNSSSALTLTVPTNSSVAFPIGTIIKVRKGGAGDVTISGATGVTINAPFGNTITTQYQTVALMKVDTNTWDLLA
jgi:hypothetical protein